MKKVHDKNNESLAAEHVDKNDTAWKGALFIFIFGSFAFSAFTAHLVYKESGDDLLTWAWLAIVFAIILITLLSIPNLVNKSIAAREEKLANFDPKKSKINLYKMILGVILFFSCVFLGYQFSTITTLFTIPIVLAINLISEGHHEEIIANKTKLSDIATYILFASMTVLYVVGIDTLQCEKQTEAVYVISQVLVISAGFTCNTILFYGKKWALAGFNYVNRPKPSLEAS